MDLVCFSDYLFKYRYCFVNEKGSMAPKMVMFTMDIGDAPRAPGAPNEHEEGHTKLEDMVIIRKLNFIFILNSTKMPLHLLN